MEFSDIQPVSPIGKLQPTSIRTAADLIATFGSRANVGDQIEMFFSFAEGQPETAMTVFSTILRNETRLPLKALALRGFGKISDSHLSYKQELASCKPGVSQELLKLFCNEIENRKRSSALTAWSAAEALKEIGFLPDNIHHPQGGNLSETPRRIQNEILDRKIQQINKIQRFRSDSRREFTAEYERFLEFWAYGPTSEFFNVNLTTANYLEIVKDILHWTQIRGVQLGLNSSNHQVQEESLSKVDFIFRQYENSEQGEFKRELGNSLKRFLQENHNSESDLQILVRAFIYEIPEYDLDYSMLSRWTIEKIRQEINRLQSLHQEILSTFSSAITVSSERAISDFLFQKKNKHINLVISWIEKIEQQKKVISASSISQKNNIELIGNILNSIKSYDAALYLQISNDINSRIQRLHSSLARTQEEHNSANKQLIEIKQVIQSSLSSKLSSLNNEVSKLKLSYSKKDEMTKEMFKYGAIFVAIGIFAEVIASLVLVVLIIVGIIIALAGDVG
ncbi:hypothetical protein IQ249_11735 [Lusitaniella coriacea LEGE 07157]|uniref:Uncharacterized protein n=1 Tax=Lusitaniella coriacea LEGE 07157 TaxID=945747 RepID=A0A8J7DWM5_9CYAN|nr:hypothetical protein [Lusitaniella coriacea]MBE9116571.1 hypothetical protein [Lusitaniella coriacea LEGE 07157]